MLKDLKDTFSEKRLIRNILLNIFGHHLIRVLLANLFYNLKKYKRVKNKANFIKLDKNGYQNIENFLSKKDFQKIKKQIEKFKKSQKPKIIKSNGLGSQKWVRYDLSKFVLSKKNNFIQKNFLRNKSFLDLLIYAEGKDFKLDYIYYDEIYELNKNKRLNETECFHRDTFYPSFKAWYYLNDITKDNAPFNVIKGSHKLTFYKIIFEYTKSIFFKNRRDSLNLEKKDFFYNSQNSEKIITNKNSLLFANTFAFHAKGKQKKGLIRKAINFNFKKAPFI
tara:strand:- start:16 stop:849 length:834 start_codon:yes stop_codon:yes gene_type:complete